MLRPVVLPLFSTVIPLPPSSFPVFLPPSLLRLYIHSLLSNTPSCTRFLWPSHPVLVSSVIRVVGVLLCYPLLFCSFTKRLPPVHCSFRSLLLPALVCLSPYVHCSHFVVPLFGAFLLHCLLRCFLSSLTYLICCASLYPFPVILLQSHYRRHRHE